MLGLRSSRRAGYLSKTSERGSMTLQVIRTVKKATAHVGILYRTRCYQSRLLDNKIMKCNKRSNDDVVG